MTMRRRMPAALVLIGVFAIGLTGCSPAPNFALRLNENGTVDLGSCESLPVVDRIEAETYVRTDSEDTTTELSPPVIPSAIHVGDVLSLGTVPPLDRWDRIGVYVFTNSEGRFASGIFDLRSLRVGEWTWAVDPSLFGRAEHCDLDG